MISIKHLFEGLLTGGFEYDYQSKDETPTKDFTDNGKFVTKLNKSIQLKKLARKQLK